MCPKLLPLGMCISGKNTTRYSLRSIRIIFENWSIKNPRRTHAPRIHAHTMTQGEAFMICLKSICLFQQLCHQHSTSKLFQRGLRQIDLHAPKTNCYLFIYLFYWTQPAWRWTRTVSFYNLFVTSIRSVEQRNRAEKSAEKHSLPKRLALSNRGRYSPPEVVKAHASQRSVQQHWEEPCNK